MTDIAIVGGGGIGSAIAYFLKRMGPEALSVTVYEKDPSYARAATALAAGGIRQQFTTPENILMSRYGFEFLGHVADALAVGGDRPQVSLRPNPYLLLGGEADLDVLRESFEVQTRLDTGAAWLDRDDLRGRFPWMFIDDVAGGILGGPGEGVFDPYGLLQALKRKAMALGATFKRAEIAGFKFGRAGACEAVLLADGSAQSCGAVVNAAGASAGMVAAMAGFELPVVPVKGHSFVFHTRSGPAGLPILIDRIQGLNVRPEGESYLAGVTARDASVDAPVDFEIDYGLFDSVAWPALAHRVRDFEAIKMTGAWVGHVEWNAFDGNAVIGAHPECTNFYFANGFSGHGAQHMPAAGRAVAELVLFGGFRTLDLSRFGYQRILENRPLPERC